MRKDCRLDVLAAVIQTQESVDHAQHVAGPLGVMGQRFGAMLPQQRFANAVPGQQFAVPQGAHSFFVLGAPGILVVIQVLQDQQVPLAQMQGLHHVRFQIAHRVAFQQLHQQLLFAGGQVPALFAQVIPSAAEHVARVGADRVQRQQRGFPVRKAHEQGEEQLQVFLEAYRQAPHLLRRAPGPAPDW